jgi:hypothetical protein
MPSLSKYRLVMALVLLCLVVAAACAIAGYWEAAIFFLLASWYAHDVSPKADMRKLSLRKILGRT